MTIPRSFRSHPSCFRRLVIVMGIVLGAACQNEGSSGDDGGNGGGPNESENGSETGESGDNHSNKEDDGPDASTHEQGNVSLSEGFVFTTGHQGEKRLFFAGHHGGAGKRWTIHEVSFSDHFRLFGDAALTGPTKSGFPRVVVGMDRRSELEAPQGRRFGVFAWESGTFRGQLLPRQVHPGGIPPHVAAAASGSAVFAMVGRRNGRSGIIVGQKVPGARGPDLQLIHSLDDGSRISHLRVRQSGTGGHTLAWLNRGALRFRRFDDSGWKGPAVKVGDSQCQTIASMDVGYAKDDERLQAVYSCTAAEGEKARCLIRAAPWKPEGNGFDPVTVTVADPGSSCQPFRSHAPAVAQGAPGPPRAVFLVRAGDAANPRWDLAWARKENNRAWRTTSLSHERAKDVTGYPFLSQVGSGRFRMLFVKSGEVHTVTVADGAITGGSKSGAESPVTAILDYRRIRGNGEMVE